MDPSSSMMGVWVMMCVCVGDGVGCLVMGKIIELSNYCVPADLVTELVS